MHFAIGAIHWADWSVVGLYFLGVAVTGLWCARRQNSTEQYFVSGRSVPGWAAGLSLFGSSISTATFLAYPGNGFRGDWVLLLPGFMLPLALIFVSLVVIPFYRRVVRMSVYEYLEHRFGHLARSYAAVLYLLNNLFRMGFVLFLTGKALHAMTGWDTVQVILVGGGITIAYTVIGGLDAVIWTDVFQVVILLFGGLLCAGMALAACGNEPWEAIRIAYDADKFRLADLSLDLAKPTVLVMVLYGLFSFSSGYSTTQDTVQRYLATPTTRAARRGLWLGAGSCILTWTLFMLIGTLLYVYYRLHPDQLPPSVASKEIEVFPYFVMTHLPRGMPGLVVAAMLAAGMSTLSSQMNTMSMVTVCDFWNRSWPLRAERHQVLLSKLTTCFWGIAGTAAALSMLRVERALGFSYVVYSILGGGLFGIFLLALLVRRAHGRGVYVGLAVGILVSLWGTIEELVKIGLPVPAFIRAFPFPLHSYLLIVCSNIASFAAGWIASLVLPAGPHRGHSLTIWDSPSAEPQREELLAAQ